MAGDSERFLRSRRVGFQWVARDRDARGCHAGLETEASLARLIDQVEGACVLPLAAWVVSGAWPDFDCRDRTALSVLERGAPERVEARLVQTAPPAAGTSGHADPGDAAAERRCITPCESGFPIPLGPIALSEVTLDPSLQDFMNRLAASTLALERFHTIKSPLEGLGFSIAPVMTTLCVGNTFGTGFAEEALKGSAAPESRQQRILDDEGDAVPHCEP